MQENFNSIMRSILAITLLWWILYFMLCIKIFAAVWKEKKNSKHHTLRPEVIPCELLKPKIENAQKQGSHSDWKDIMIVIHLMSNKLKRGGWVANIMPYIPNRKCRCYEAHLRSYLEIMGIHFEGYLLGCSS